MLDGVRSPSHPSAPSIPPIPSARLSNVVRMPIGSPRKYRPRPDTVASQLPSAMLPPFDIIEQLRDNRSRYIGKDWFTLYGFPSYLLTCLEILREKVGAGRQKPGLSPTIVCGMSYGLIEIMGDEGVRSTLELKRALFLDQMEARLPVDDVEELAQWFRTFPLSLPDNTTCGDNKINVAMPESIHASMADIAHELGTSASSLAMMSIAVTMSEQKWVIPERKAELERARERFFGRIARRCRVAHTWLDDLRKAAGVPILDLAHIEPRLPIPAEPVSIPSRHQGRPWSKQAIRSRQVTTDTP